MTRGDRVYRWTTIGVVAAGAVGTCWTWWWATLAPYAGWPLPDTVRAVAQALLVGSLLIVYLTTSFIRPALSPRPQSAPAARRLVAAARGAGVLRTPMGARHRAPAGSGGPSRRPHYFRRRPPHTTRPPGASAAGTSTAARAGTGRPVRTAAPSHPSR